VIQKPRRSVTRFFIPLIDVLILLFCIFLLMPFVSKPDDGKGNPDAVPAVRDPSMPDDVEKLQQELAIARRRIEDLKKQRANLGERLSVRVVEIDKATGKLFYFDADGGGRLELKDQADAQRLINQQRSRAGAKDVFFLLLYPRELSGFPLRDQVETYRRWFKDVPHGFDNPWAAGG
jgi:uncharacterized ParB-like nuclease family protein